MLSFFRRNLRELLLLVGLFAAFLVVNPLIQYLVPEAGALDWSFLTLLVAGLFKAVFIACSVWLLIAVFVPTVNGFLDSHQFRQAFMTLEPHQKLRAVSITILTILSLVTLCVLFG